MHGFVGPLIPFLMLEVEEVDEGGIAANCGGLDGWFPDFEKGDLNERLSVTQGERARRSNAPIIIYVSLL